jgi:uncharacterized protein (TIGR02996 family)
MSDGDALYRAVLANPDDDTPRLVYADWLQENGRAEEAEFIRAECRLHADEPYDADLLDRQGELRLWLKTHVPGPKLKFPAGLKVADGADWWELTHRGFPQFLEFEGYGRDGLKPIRALAAALEKAFAMLPTRWLVVRFVTVEQLAELLRQPVIAGLEVLTIQLGASEEPRDDVGRLLADCRYLRNLRGLALGFSPGIAGVEAMARSEFLSRLRALFLEPGTLTPATVRALAGSEWFRGLYQLSLNDNCPADVFEELCGQKPFPNLHTIALADNDFPAPVWHAFARSKAFPALAELILTRTDLSGGRFAPLAAAGWFRPSALDVSACAIGNDGAAELARAPWVASLTRLDLRHNGLGPVGAAAIARCPHLVRLKHLDLGYNALGARALQALATNPALRGLTALWLCRHAGVSRGLTPAHFEHFLRNLDMPGLRQLDLSGHPVGPKAARLLAAEKFHSLTRLVLSGCKLTGAAVATLVAAPALQNLIELDVSNNGLKAGISLLTDRQTLPRLSQGRFHTNRIGPDLVRRLNRRPGVIA